MRVLLQDVKTGYYYSAPGTWVRDRDSAKDFRLVEDALSFNDGNALQATHVVLAYDSPACNLTLPVGNYANYERSQQRPPQ